MTENELTDLVLKVGQACGFEDKENGFFRANKKAINGIRYFGFIFKGNNTEEENGLENTEIGRYWDLSLVFFPEVEGVDKKNLQDNGNGKVNSFLVSLGVGSNGFAFDQELASRPGTRRKYLKLHTKGEQEYQFFKNVFTDITTNLVKEKKEVKPKIDSQYSRLLQAGQYIKLTDDGKLQVQQGTENNAAPQMKRNEEDDKWKDIKDTIGICDNNLIITIGKWIATYAQMRDWGTECNKKIIKELLPEPQIIELAPDNIYKILEKDRFVVLQGAPGTGKTWSANEVAKKFDKDNVLFEQFHAETTYSDFIWGIQPKLKESTLLYDGKKGILIRAIEQAKLLEEKFNKSSDETEKHKNAVLLIIDEINRANLSNVLGPVFYLFEKGASHRTHKIKIGDIEIDKLPENMYVIATMNTADRSLAVVDFALRRRFTWLTLKPHVIDSPSGKKFMVDYFKEMAEIFEEYATDEELNLQPGQSYFLVEKTNNDIQEKEMRERLRYELMPLIKEYLNEGYLASAKEVFCNYFYQTIGELMYE